MLGEEMSNPLPRGGLSLFGMYTSGENCALAVQMDGGAIIVGDGVTAVFDSCLFSVNGAPACGGLQNTQVLLTSI